MVHQTNLYHEQFVRDTGEENISDFSFAKFFPAEGLTSDDMVRFIALTYCMGVVKKEKIRDYWSMDSIIETPFVRTVMSRNFFQTILTFFHLADNDIYPKTGSDDYDPRKKLGYLFTLLSSSFTDMWIP